MEATMSRLQQQQLLQELRADPNMWEGGLNIGQLSWAVRTFMGRRRRLHDGPRWESF